MSKIKDLLQRYHLLHYLRESGLPTDTRRNIRCPFPDHRDSSPSFRLYPDGGFCCFGCGRKGNVIDYIMHERCCDRDRALELYRQAAGDVPSGSASQGKKRVPRDVSRTAKHVPRDLSCTGKNIPQDLSCKSTGNTDLQSVMCGDLQSPTQNPGAYLSPDSDEILSPDSYGTQTAAPRVSSATISAGSASCSTLHIPQDLSRKSTGNTDLQSVMCGDLQSPTQNPGAYLSPDSDEIQSPDSDGTQTAAPRVSSATISAGSVSCSTSATPVSAGSASCSTLAALHQKLYIKSFTSAAPFTQRHSAQGFITIYSL